MKVALQSFFSLLGGEGRQSVNGGKACSVVEMCHVCVGVDHEKSTP